MGNLNVHRFHLKKKKNAQTRNDRIPIKMPSRTWSILVRHNNDGVMRDAFLIFQKIGRIEQLNFTFLSGANVSIEYWLDHRL